VFVKNGISGIAGFLELAILPIRTMFIRPARSQPLLSGGRVRKVALLEEVGGVSTEKPLLSGEAAAVQPMVLEMIKAGRKMVLEGFPLEEIAAWSALGDAERRAVMEQLPERLRQMSSPAN